MRPPYKISNFTHRVKRTRQFVRFLFALGIKHATMDDLYHCKQFVERIERLNAR